MQGQFYIFLCIFGICVYFLKTFSFFGFWINRKEGVRGFSPSSQAGPAHLAHIFPLPPGLRACSEPVRQGGTSAVKLIGRSTLIVFTAWTGPPDEAPLTPE